MRFHLTLLVAHLGSPGAAQAAAEHVRQADMALPKTRDFFRVIESGTATTGSLSAGLSRAPMCVGWKITSLLNCGNIDRRWSLPPLEPERYTYAKLRGTATLLVGNLVLAVTLEWIAQADLPGTFSGPVNTHSFDRGCFYCRYTQTDWLSGRVLGDRTTRLICLPEFLAEFERVFLIAVKALLDGLPKG